jgi:hypothetical protein
VGKLCLGDVVNPVGCAQARGAVRAQESILRNRWGRGSQTGNLALITYAALLHCRAKRDGGREHRIIRAFEIEFVNPLDSDAQCGPQFGVGASGSITLLPVGELLAFKAWIFRAEEPLLQAANRARHLNSNCVGTFLQEGAPASLSPSRRRYARSRPEGRPDHADSPR